MTGRVLVVDPVVTTRIVLKVKLAAACFRVSHAATMKDALAEIAREAPDVVLCENTLPDGGAAQLQTKLRGQDIPVIALMPEGDSRGRIAALAAGLGDVLARPYDDRTILARVRNLLRARTAHDELRMRSHTAQALGAPVGFNDAATGFAPAARIALMADTREQGLQWKSDLSDHVNHNIDVLSPTDLAGPVSSSTAYDAYLIEICGHCAEQRLDFVSNLRARADTRRAAILAISPENAASVAITALDIGAGDVMATGFEGEEVALRLTRLLRRKSSETALRQSLEDGLLAAVTDPLTGLYNRRYAMPYLSRMALKAAKTERSFALMVLDLDHFKRVNDTYGHCVGDEVLVEFAERLKGNLRSVDMIGRLGGEEFLVAMPDTTLQQAAAAADRICELTCSENFARNKVQGGVNVSVSVGLALGGPTVDAPEGWAKTPVETLLSRADQALYDAKSAGRNMVRVCKTAA